LAAVVTTARQQGVSGAVLPSRLLLLLLLLPRLL
jgi:hypothetical protein